MGSPRITNLNLGGKRREKRYIQLLDHAFKDSSTSIAKLGSNHHQSKAYYRLLSNFHLTTQAILDAHGEQIGQRIDKQKTALCIQDTTEILAAKGVGRLNYDARQGYYPHH